MVTDKIPNFGLHWLGWETDIVTLARQGWNFYTETNIEYRVYAMVIQHNKFNIIGYLPKVTMEFMENYQYGMGDRFPKLPVEYINFKKAITIQTISNNIKYSSNNYNSEYNFSEVKEVWDMPHTISIKLEDLLPNKEEKESRIILPEYTIPELMNMIKEKQRPMQDEIRKRKAKDEHVEKPVAQIISIA